MTQQPVSGHSHEQSHGEDYVRPTSRPVASQSRTVIVAADEDRLDHDDQYDRPGRTAEHDEFSVARPLYSRIRGGAVWGGFVVGFATWILLEVALFAFDLEALAANFVPQADDATWWWSGLAALIAFLLGGLVAGASTSSRDATDGVLHGITVWSLTVVALILLSATGAGIGFGVVSDVLATSPSLAEADTAALNDAQTAAAGALLALTATLVAAAMGGALGAKMWPMRDDMIDLRDRSRVRHAR